MKFLSVVAALLVSVVSANAGTYNVSFEAHDFTPAPALLDPVSGSFTITIIDGVTYTDSTDIVVNTSPIPALGQFGFSTGSFGGKPAVFIGLVPVGSLSAGTDIGIVIVDFFTAPALASVAYTLPASRVGPFFSSTGSVTVSDITQTPLPATLPLFAGGLGGLAWLAARRKRVAKV